MLEKGKVIFIKKQKVGNRGSQIRSHIFHISLESFQLRRKISIQEGDAEVGGIILYQSPYMDSPRAYNRIKRFS